MCSRLLQSCSFQWAIANRSALKPESWERAEPGQTAGAPWPCLPFSDDSRRLRPRRIEEGLVPALLHGYLRATANKQVRAELPPDRHPSTTRVPPEGHPSGTALPPDSHPSATPLPPECHVRTCIRTYVRAFPSATQVPPKSQPMAT